MEKTYLSEEMIRDGVNWNLELKFKNYSSKNFNGSNAFPYNFNCLIELLKKLLIDEGDFV